MLYVIPFSDDVTAWSTTPLATWILILLVSISNIALCSQLTKLQSGFLACLLNLSQFIIIDEAGAVSSTIVGHFKSCVGILLGWIYSGKSLKDGSVFGIVLAIGGIIS